MHVGSAKISCGAWEVQRRGQYIYKYILPFLHLPAPCIFLCTTLHYFLHYFLHHFALLFLLKWELTFYRLNILFDMIKIHFVLSDNTRFHGVTYFVLRSPFFHIAQLHNFCNKIAVR